MTVLIAGAWIIATIVLLALLALAVAFASSPSLAQGQADSTSSLHAGSVSMKNPTERKLFERLLCECGDCQRLPLSSCSCGWAEDMRAKVRGRMSDGDGVTEIMAWYRDIYGSQALAIPADEGLDRALWAVPLILQN